MKYIELFKDSFPANITEKCSPENGPYVSYSIVDGHLLFTMASSLADGPANNEIWYTSSDGNTVNISSSGVFGANIVSNSYENGKGVITFDGDVTCVENGAFVQCSTLTSVIIPNSVTSIIGGTFNNCSSLTSVIIPDGVTTIGNAAFSNCSSLTSFTIPNSLITIGDATFYNCTGLTSITIPNSVTSIGITAFQLCSGLTSITIGNNVTTIKDAAFVGCSSLTSITIPNSVTSIGQGAFSGCTRLTYIIYEGTKEQWNAISKIINSWNAGVPAAYVQCTDGQVPLQ